MTPSQPRGAPSSFGEADLWILLAVTILSSQVRYELAREAVKQLCDAALIPPIAVDIDLETHASSMVKVLSRRLDVDGYSLRYRFPNTKARQLASTYHRLKALNLTLLKLTAEDVEPLAMRSRLISLIDGFGPKQASMFMRDSGICCELAILDRHVIKYMTTMGLIDDYDGIIGSVEEYAFVEREFINYSKFLGYPVGSVDQAVWMVMRVSSGEK